MILQNAAFFLFAALTLGAAAGVVLSRDPLRSALCLGLSLAGAAGLYATMGADFLFAVQLLLCVGAVSLVVLLTAMLAGRAPGLRLERTNDLWMAALLVCGSIFWGVARCASAYGDLLAPGPARPSTAALGRLFVGEWAVPFELVTLLLLAAMVGVVVFARPEDPAVPEGQAQGAASHPEEPPGAGDAAGLPGGKA